METVDAKPAWPVRAWALAVLGAVVGLAIHWLTDDPEQYRMTRDAFRLAVATFLGVGGIAFALTLERVRIHWSVAFAVGAGLVVASVIYWNGGPGRWDANDGWRFFCGLLAVGIAAPLFQAMRDQGRRVLPYAAVHDHAWTNVVLGALALAFLGIVWLLAWLLASLFNLIGIDLLRELMRKEWFGWLLSGAALGAGLGMLRDQDRVVGMLQRVVMIVLSVLAPVLGAGLLIFLLAIPFTGLKPLWEATRDTTPILLSCCAGALILANAVIGDGPEDEARNRLLRWGALALALAILPLAVIAAISTGLRLDQYGLSPSRLWALVFIAFACAVGLAYLVALAVKRMGWAEAARPANLRLGIGLCGLMLLLSTPLISFGALSVGDQVARLEAGRVTPAQFDWAALAFDFGPAGRKAVERLAQSPDAAIKAAAAKALATKDRWELARDREAADDGDVFAERTLVFPTGTSLPPELVAAILREDNGCGQKKSSLRCIVRYEPGGEQAILLKWWQDCKSCTSNVVQLVRMADGNWNQAGRDSTSVQRDESGIAAQRAAAERGEIEVREVKRRQIFVGGKPVGDVFE